MFSNIVVGMPFFNIMINTDKSNRDYHAEYSEGEGKSRSKIYFNTLIDLKNAPGNYELILYGGYCLAFGYKMLPANYSSSFTRNFNSLSKKITGKDRKLPSHYPSSLGSTFNFHIWKFKLENSFLYFNNYEEFSYYAYYSVPYIIYDFNNNDIADDLYYTVIEKALVDILRNEKTFIYSSLVKKKFTRNSELKIAYSRRKLIINEEWTTDDPHPNALFENGTKSTTNDFGEIYRANVYSANFMHYRSRLKFDPAYLGRPHFKVETGIDLFANEYPAEKNAYSRNYYTGKKNVIKAHLDLRNCYLLFDSKLSIIIKLDGFAYLGAIKDNKVTLYMYDFIGHGKFYSGYPYSIIRPWRSIRAVAEIRFNPFVSVFDKTHWYERISSGIKFETGYCLYNTVDNKSIPEYPLSCEGSIMYSFYIWPGRRKSNAFVKYAAPLKQVENMDMSSYRLYFGLSI